MEEIEKCDCPHFLILFRDSKLQFRALYAYYPDTEEVELENTCIHDHLDQFLLLLYCFCRCLKSMELGRDK